MHSPKNDHVFPTSQHVLSQSRLHSIDFSFEKIPKIIRLLDVNKELGHDDISIKMVRIFYNASVRPLSLLFRTFFENFCFPELWKKIEYYTSSQKNGKHSFENYRPI